MIITVDKTFYGSEVRIDGTYLEIIKGFEDIVRALVYNGFEKDDIRTALVDGFYEDPDRTPIDGNKVTDKDIHKAIEVSGGDVKTVKIKLKEKEGE